MHGKKLQDAASGRKRGPLRGLLALNAALLGVLGAVTFGPAADAQVRPRGEYTMVAGDAKNSLASVVYIVDTANQELIALSYDVQSRQLVGLGYRNLSADAATRLRSR